MTQTVLVTGASSGIGKATALLLKREGFTVFGTTRRPDAIGPQEFPMLSLDVRSDDSVKALLRPSLRGRGVGAAGVPVSQRRHAARRRMSPEFTSYMAL